MTDLEQAIVTIFNKLIKEVYTTFPASVIEYDEKTQLAKIQPLIKIDGIELMPIPSVPVQHIGGDWMVVTEIAAGVEGMASVCMRDLTAWLHDADATSSRKFSPSDSWFSPGIRSEAKAIPDLENNGVQLRNRKGDQFFWLKNDGDSYVSGNLFVDKEIKAKGDVYSNDEVLTKISHKHAYIDSVGTAATPTERTTEEAQE